MKRRRLFEVIDSLTVSLEYGLDDVLFEEDYPA